MALSLLQGPGPIPPVPLSWRLVIASARGAGAPTPPTRRPIAPSWGWRGASVAAPPGGCGCAPCVVGRGPNHTPPRHRCPVPCRSCGCLPRRCPAAVPSTRRAVTARWRSLVGSSAVPAGGLGGTRGIRLLIASIGKISLLPPTGAQPTCITAGRRQPRRCGSWRRKAP